MSAAPMQAMKWFFSLGVYAAMIGLCLLRLEMGGAVGLGVGALGFVLGYLAPGQTNGEERLGNGYVGSLVGLVLGFLGGAAWYLLWPQLGVEVV